MDRREFLTRTAAAGAGMALAGAAANRAYASEEKGGMTYRQCKEDSVSLLGYGCMRWPFIADENGNEVPDQQKINELVDYALEHGVNYFDTSPFYCRGLSEEITGIALSRHPRDSYFIATKMSNFMSELGARQREVTIQTYHDSMRKLRTDYIDYFLIHNIGSGGMERLHRNFLDIGLLEYFMEEREKGRIRRLGFSYHGDVACFDHLLSLHDKVHWDFVQIQMNYVDWKHASGRNVNAEYLYAELQQRGIPAVIMEPIRGGSLASLPQHLTARLKALRPEDSVAAWGFRYCGTFPGVLTVLSGMTYMEHLEENVRTFSPVEPCSEDELLLLEEVASLLLDYPLVPCTNCKYCMPCPYGIDIPTIFQHYNRCIKDGTVATSVQDPGYRRARRAYLVSYNRAVPALRQADHCIGCNQCASHCPQTIKIPDELHRIDRYIEMLKQDTL